MAETTPRTTDTEQRSMRSKRRDDAGFTLPELLVVIAVTAVLLTAISAALIAMLNVSGQATERLTESRDVSFIQTRVPVDLGSAWASSDALDNNVVRSDVSAQLTQLGIAVPWMAGLDALPGSNVLTVVRPDDDGGAPLVISYRYEFRDGDWVITRYEISNPGTASETVTANLVAADVAAPPLTDPNDPNSFTWEPGDSVDHAVQVAAKGVANRIAGQDMTVTFASGRTFTTGGGGLAAQEELPPVTGEGLSDPVAPPSRCGKRVAIVLDTSGSVPYFRGGAPMEAAAVGFIDGFVGTPTTVSINAFDRSGYGMQIDLTNPASYEVRAPFYSVLNETAEVQGMRDRIIALDDTDGRWKSGASTLQPVNQSNPADPNGDGIHWGQVGDGTNWHGGLLSVFRDPSGAIYASEQPDLVVFITDGQPTFVKNLSDGSIDRVSEGTAAAAAESVANDIRGFLGARVVGVMVGNASNNGRYRNYLHRIAGLHTEVWNGSVASDGTVDPGNAAEAGLFLGGFQELGGILRSIAISECGGTVTVQKRVDDGGSVSTPAAGVWNYTSNDGGTVGSKVLNREASSSVTFDYSFAPGEANKSIQITEQPVDGYVFDRAECTANGAPVSTVPNADGSPGATVTVGADQAVSCLMVSAPA